MRIRFGSLSVIRQKGESQTGYFKKTKHVKFSEKRTFLSPFVTNAWRGKKCSFLQKFSVLCFLLPYYRRIVIRSLLQNVTNVIIKCDRYFITKWEKSLLQNATVLLQFEIGITKCAGNIYSIDSEQCWYEY